MSRYDPREDYYPDNRCQCLHLDVQHKDKDHGGCPWCDCEEYQHWTETVSCCDYRDHGDRPCACPDSKHVGDPSHPFAEAAA